MKSISIIRWNISVWYDDNSVDRRITRDYNTQVTTKSRGK